MDAVTLFRDGLVLVVLLSAPSLLATTILGVAISLMQGLFQIQDQTLAYAVKVIVMVAVLIATGRWMQNEIVVLSEHMFVLLARVR